MHSINVEGLDIPWTSLTLGCMQLAPSKEWGDACSADEADRVVKAALEGGIKAFDTAGGYGDGESERRLGKALGASKNDVIIVSKIMSDTDLTLEAYQARLEGTLKNLGRDYVDVYMINYPGMYMDTLASSRRLCDIMAALKETGKARTIGISNFRAKEIVLMTDAASWFTVNEVPYNLLQREYEGETLKKCERAGIGYMAYFPIARGLLAGRFDEEALQAFARREYYLYRQPTFGHSKIVREAVQDVAEELGTAPVNVALAWVIQKKNIITAVVGARKADQVKEFCTAGGVTLTPDQLNELNEASAQFHFLGGTRLL